ncbi:MAG: hypothetical protein P8Y67_05685 [Alphaproteobacteria bacterium]
MTFSASPWHGKTEPATQAQHVKSGGNSASEAKEQSQRPPNVIMKAVMARRKSALTSGVSWRVLKSRNRKLVWSGGGGALRIHLKPGRYIVEATYGLAKSTRKIRVRRRRRVKKSISLNAGTIRAKARAVADGPLLKETTFTLYEATRKQTKTQTEPSTRIIPVSAETGKSAHVEKVEIARSTLPSTVFHVPEGDYRLVVRRGMAVSETYVHVKAGRASNVNLVMNTGVLRFSAHAESGDPPISGIQFALYDEKDKLLLSTKRDEPELTLPAGNYRVTAELGFVREERQFTVIAGKNHTEVLVLDAGWLKLSAVSGNDKRPMMHDILYKIFDLSAGASGTIQTPITLAKPSSTIFLKRGKYRVESLYGFHNARLVRDVTISAGDITDVEFEHRGCSLKLKLVTKPGASPVEKVKWTLKYASGGTVLISQDAVPDLILQEGRYQAVAQHDAKTYSRTFEAVANREQTIELIAE